MRKYNRPILSLICILALLAGLNVSCKTATTSSSDVKVQEDFSIRPHIDSVSPMAASNAPSDWQLIKKAQSIALAMFSEMYSDHEIYFLARDGEYLYDMSQVFCQDKGRFHLLNVSRNTVKDPLLDQYLAQEGISSAALSAGKKILLVDSGFSGSIFNAIRSRFSPSLQGSIKGHLLQSNHPSTYPTTNSFLVQYNSVGSYEGLPHYTGRAKFYSQSLGKIRVVTESTDTDGKVDKSQSQSLMRDIAAYSSNSSARKLFELHQQVWRYLRDAAQSSLNDSDLNTRIQKLYNEVSGSVTINEILGDFVAVATVNRIGKSNLQFNSMIFPSFATAGPTNKLFSMSTTASNKPAPQKVQSVVKFAGENFQVGDQLAVGKSKTPIEVQKLLTENNEHRIWLVLDNKGNLLTLKTVVNSDPDLAKGLKEQSESLVAIGSDYATEVLDSNETFILSRYASGTRADAWLKSWAASGYQTSDPGARKLRQMFKDLAKRGLYVGDLNPQNLIWTGSEWVIVNSGSISKSKTYEEIIARYAEKTESRWGRVLEKAGGVTGKSQGCKNLLGSLLD